MLLVAILARTRTPDTQQAAALITTRAKALKFEEVSECLKLSLLFCDIGDALSRFIYWLPQVAR
jgi:anthranilate phosphoribosyltransferase